MVFINSKFHDCRVGHPHTIKISKPAQTYGRVSTIFYEVLSFSEQDTRIIWWNIFIYSIATKLNRVL